jgi:hypothetical protein
MEVKLFAKLNNDDYNELFACNEQTLDSHATIHSYVDIYSNWRGVKTVY